VEINYSSGYNKFFNFSSRWCDWEFILFCSLCFY